MASLAICLIDNEKFGEFEKKMYLCKIKCNVVNNKNHNEHIER